jgi:hypothetical protein
VADDIVLNPGIGGATVGADLIGGVELSAPEADSWHRTVSTPAMSPQTNPLPVRQNGTTTTLTNTGASAASVTVLASNAARLRAWLFNDSTSPCYIKYGAAAAAGSCTKRMLPGEFHVIEGYTGIVDAIWDAINGSMRATELTA